MEYVAVLRMVVNRCFACFYAEPAFSSDLMLGWVCRGEGLVEGFPGSLMWDGYIYKSYAENINPQWLNTLQV